MSLAHLIRIVSSDSPKPMPSPPRIKPFYAIRGRRLRFPVRMRVLVGGACAVAALFVGSDVLIHRSFPVESTAMRHALLTIWAALLTAATAWIVYLVMKRHQARLSSTAEKLARLLESYTANPDAAVGFDNPNFVHCRDIMDCDNTACPMYDRPQERCWHRIGLGVDGDESGAPQVSIAQCRECKVYEANCPDALTELGESFNSLMFLLGRERERTQSMQSQMFDKEKMAAIGQLAAGLAHEIGNPLSSISSIAQMLKRGELPDDKRAQLDLINTHVQRIMWIVRQLGTLSRPSKEKWDLIDIGKALEESIRLVSFDRRARNVDIEVQLPQEPLPPTYGLRSGLQQVFLNLALNAMDAMPDGGTLTVRARFDDDRIFVQFADTGTGISSENRRRVFEPFFTTKPAGQGTGMGLAVSYDIIQKHRGTIDFASAPDDGTEFAIVLPRRTTRPRTESDVSEHRTNGVKQ